MKLKHLDYNKCPICGSRIISEGRSHQHSNGQWFEHVIFECGCEIKWVPNFSREETSRQCPKHSDEVSKNDKRVKAQEKVRKYILKLDVDEEFKDELTRYF